MTSAGFGEVTAESFNEQVSALEDKGDSGGVGDLSTSPSGKVDSGVEE
jgi:hypothetical protein